MKQLIKMSIVFLGLMLNISIYAVMFGEADILTEPMPGRIETTQIAYIVDAVAYAPGGVTFVYPVGIFSIAPCVQVQANVPSTSADTMFVASVMANSVTSVTVMVYKISSTSGVPTGMVEASLPDNVTVCLYATGV